MLKDCIYPFTDYIVPHCINSQKVNPLQYRCAIALMQSRDLLQYYIRGVPTKLFPYLFQAAIFHTFSKSSSWKVAWFSDSIVLLIQYWPFENFILRDLLTTGFVPVSSSNHLILRVNQEAFKTFLDKLVTLLIKAFIYERNGIKRKLRKFDISGVGVNVEEIFTLPIFQNIKKQTFLEDSEKPVAVPNEFICDVYFIKMEQYSSYLKAILPNGVNGKESPNVVAVFDAICIASLPANNVINIIKCISKLPRVRYLELSLCNLDQQFIDSLSTSRLSKPLEGLSISYCVFTNLPESCNFSFLKNFENLHQLDMSGTHSRIGWSILGELPNGLTFLKMVGCSVKMNDFICLTKHPKHCRTLIQLDLSENRLSEENTFIAFADFIGSLQKIKVLELQSCKLGDVPSDLLESFKSKLISGCPHLIILQMLENDIGYNFLLHKFIDIGQKSSLRLLCLMMPSDVYLDDNYETTEHLMNTLKNAYNFASQSRDGCQLCFEWKEEATYSHWFYST